MNDTEKQSIRVRALAKINLFLDVTGKRPDGYHLVNMAMQSIDLHDVLTVSVDAGTCGPNGEFRDTLRIEDASGTGVFARLEADDRNLVLRAAKALRERCAARFPNECGLSFVLQKRIPMEAGLGGGSADAAAALLAVNRLFTLGLTDTELAETALTLGADVPFCLTGGTMRAQGIGEVLTPLPDMADCVILIAKPSGSASTKEIYSALDAKTDTVHPDWDAFETALGNAGRSAASFASFAGSLANVLEPVTTPLVPAVGELVHKLPSLGAPGARMTGSGSAVFGLFSDSAAAEDAMDKLKREDPALSLFLTRPVNSSFMAENRFF
ncbi:MAG: 4-(cytidine 5'-diphospho)-2-C-methyl-D-erythritol kinase [Lachnospiraceae bacterium]|nr:4-(cytidine 5'-diphospho)-2-C-methyl-D-erythritol kinase [Lachnospiraceae bacterium]